MVRKPTARAPVGPRIRKPAAKTASGSGPTTTAPQTSSGSKPRSKTVAEVFNGVTSTRFKATIGSRIQKLPRSPTSPRRKRPIPQTKEGQVAHKKRQERYRHPENFPDLDFHQSFGSFFTRKNPISKEVDPKIASLWKLLSRNPSSIQRKIFRIRERYLEAFQQFFKADGISLHGHVSDAANPNLLMSLLLHVQDPANRESVGDDSANGVELVAAANRDNPRIAVADGSYGAAYGPLAYESVLFDARSLANGPKPFVVKTQMPAKIDSQIRKAKLEGCVALIVEIVRAADGTIISEAAWQHLLNACRKHSLVLVVDETLTAIRCGAPFAYQLPQYAQFGLPDLVLFGKAVRTNGIAIVWEGINIQKLEIDDDEERQNVALHWLDRFTASATATDLLNSWGTILLAGKEDWPSRAVTVGELVRRMLEEEDIDPLLIGGLHSLLYMRQKDYVSASPVMVANTGKYVRLFPTMDEVMTSEVELLHKVFGEDSLEHRAEVADFLGYKGMRLHWCSKCGSAVPADIKDICKRCVVSQCEDCEPGAHQCPMEALGFQYTFEDPVQ